MNQASWRTNTRKHTQSQHPCMQAHTLTNKEVSVCRNAKLTRLASKQASESVINLFSLAPRSCGRGLIRGRGLFSAELCMKEKERSWFKSRDSSSLQFLRSHPQLGDRRRHSHHWFVRLINLFTCRSWHFYGQNPFWFSAFCTNMVDDKRIHDPPSCPPPLLQQWLRLGSTHRFPLGAMRLSSSWSIILIPLFLLVYVSHIF